jgi:hypothetical protein
MSVTDGTVLSGHSVLYYRRTVLPGGVFSFLTEGRWMAALFF